MTVQSIFVIVSSAVLVSTASLVASADTTADPYRPAISTPNPHPFRVGFSGDLGLPSGIALGLVAHPKVDWLSLNLSATYNGMSPGLRMSVRFDPMALKPNLPVGIFLDPQVGYADKGNSLSLLKHQDFPSIGYDYANFFGGLRLGKATGFNWSFEVGPSYLHVNTSNFQSVANKSGSSVLLGNPTVNGWFAPAFQTGFQVVWP